MTVSLPSELVERLETIRAKTGQNRSEVVTEVCWRGWWALEDEEELARTRAAYRAHPETHDEAEFSDWAAEQAMADWDPWDSPEAEQGTEVKQAS
jgi:metal-responsive CopG/Arc/MetJ family transcriptional regulator